MAKTPEKHSQPWTKADDAKLRELTKHNTPTGLLAHNLGRTEGAVRSHARAIGLSLKPVNRSPYGTVAPKKRKAR
jgi:hypothetical protein